MKKKIGIIIGAVSALMLLIIGIYIFATGGFSPYERKIRMGYKLINKEQYEEAILTFNEAIEIDDKSYKAYGGLAKTYVTRCDENAVNDAHEALSRGYEISTSEDIINQYLVLADELLERNKEDLAFDLLNKGYETTNDKIIKDKINKIILDMNLDLFKELYSLFESNDLEQVKQLMTSEKFSYLNNLISIEVPVIYSPDTEGKGMGIYKIGSKLTQLFIYYGDYADLSRSGSGVWIGKDFDNYWYMFNGTWSNDLPNGYGEVKKDGIIDDEIDAKFEWKGNLIDGLWHGDVEEIWISDRTTSFNINFVNGVATVIGEDNLVGRSNDGEGICYSDPENKHGILGFTKM